MNHNPFEFRSDPVVGEALRAHLTPVDQAAFVHRVMQRLRREALTNPWDVLAGWARPGIAAALFLLAALGYGLVLSHPAGTAPTATEVLASSESMDGEALVGIMLGAGR